MLLKQLNQLICDKSLAISNNFVDGCFCLNKCNNHMYVIGHDHIRYDAMSFLLKCIKPFIDSSLSIGYLE